MSNSFFDVNSDAERIESLVVDYQVFGQDRELLALLDTFSPLIRKYVKFLTLPGNIEETQIDDDFAFLIFGSFHGDDFERKVWILEKIFYMRACFRQFSMEDIESELKAILISKINRYEDVGKSFLGYVASTFHYDVARFIKEITKEQTAWNPRTDSLNGEVNIDHLPYEYLSAAESDDILNDQFIFDPSLDVFKVLTPQERHVLKLYFEDGLMDKEIADRKGVHINTQSTFKRNAIHKLEAITGLKYKRTRNASKQHKRSKSFKAA